jgi:6-phosphogluconate dehydrogenase
MKIAIVGLGRMGMQVARKLAEGGHDVIAHNRSRGPVDRAATKQRLKLLSLL